MGVENDPLLLLAAQNYKVPGATTEEFLKDLARVGLVSRTISKYSNGHQTNVRLLLNNIVMLSNSFGVHATVELLMRKVPVENHGILFPLMVYLGYMTDEQLTDHVVQFDAQLIGILRSL